MMPAAQRLSAASGPGFAEHRRCFGPLPGLAPASLSGLVHDAGLTGRGGAGFPTGRKLQSVRGRDAVVIGNGAEGEPLSQKDVWLMNRAPHLVLDGLVLTAADVAARDIYLYIPSRSISAMRRAIAERRAGGAIERTVCIVASPETFVAGEKSAVVNRIQGGRARPTDQVESTSASGVRRRPTLVSNVETLAHIALIARYGPQWFRSVGDHLDPGTMLVTLSGAVAGGVVEVPTGTTLSALIGHAGRTDPRQLAAVLLGGYHGRWIPAADIHGVRAGRGSGTGIVHALAIGECGVLRTADIVDYLAGQSARQCGPCHNGLPWLAQMMRALADGHGGDTLLTETQRIAALVDGRGSCHHPDGTARLVRTALSTFGADIVLHSRGRCVAAEPAGMTI